MEKNEEEHCHICFKQPKNALLDFEPYEELVQKVTQVKTDISRLILNKICESCAKELIIIDIFRTRFIEANEKWAKMLESQDDSQSRPGPKRERCEECGMRGETSVDLQTWKRVCSNCSTDSNLPLELMNEEDIKQELPFSLEDMMVQTLEQFPEETGPKVEKKEGNDPLGVLPKNIHLNSCKKEYLKKKAAPRLVGNSRKRKTATKDEKEPAEPKAEPIGKCQTCRRKFYMQSEWELHNETGHTSICKYCNYKGKDYSKLKNHVLTHLPHLWSNLCDFCGAKFAQIAAFRIHYAGHDPDGSIYKCHFCDRCYTRKVNLRDHIVARHLKIRRFQCKYCPKAYLGLTDRDRHQYIHTGNWPVRCRICDKGFPRKRELMKHMPTHE